MSCRFQKLHLLARWAIIHGDNLKVTVMCIVWCHGTTPSPLPALHQCPRAWLTAVCSGFRGLGHILFSRRQATCLMFAGLWWFQTCDGRTSSGGSPWRLSQSAPHTWFSCRESSTDCFHHRCRPPPVSTHSPSTPGLAITMSGTKLPRASTTSWVARGGLNTTAR